MNNIMIKTNNAKEYNKTLVILGNLGVIWSNGQTIDAEDYETDFYDSIPSLFELNNVFKEEYTEENDELVICLIVEYDKLFWVTLDNMADSCFDINDYEVYTFEDFEKAYSL